MANAQQVIDQASTMAGIKAIGDPLDGDSNSYALLCLNAMLDSWQTENLMIPFVSETVATATTNPVTIGAGQTINVARPKFIRDTSFIRSNNIDYPITWITEADYTNIFNKSLSSTIAWYAYYDGQFPVGNIYFYPNVSGASIHLQLDAILPQFADYSTDYAIDKGYLLALYASLAEILCIGVKPIPPDVALLANNQRNLIRQNNLKINRAKIDPFLTSRRYNWRLNAY